MSEPWAALRGHDFVRLTTFRRSGVGVTTAMWFAELGPDIVFSTPAGAGKLKRLRHTSRVTLQASSRRGHPVDGSPTLEGVARLAAGPEERGRVEAALNAKYGWQWRIALAVEKGLGRVRRRPVAPRVAIVVSSSDA